MVSRIRNAVVLMRAKPAESMVEDAADRAGVAHLVGGAGLGDTVSRVRVGVVDMTPA